MSWFDKFSDGVRNTLFEVSKFFTPSEEFSCAHCISCRQSLKTTSKGNIRIFTCPYVNEMYEEYLREVLPDYFSVTPEEYYQSYLKNIDYIYKYRSELNLYSIDDISKPLLNEQYLPIFSHDELKNRYNVRECGQFRPYFENDIAILNPDLYTPLDGAVTDYINFYELPREDQEKIMGRYDF